MAFVQSIQVGSIAPLGPRGELSAIIKRAVSGAVRAERLGLEGDEQADLAVHGGPDKAVYFYALEQYPRWAADVPRHAGLLVAGGFGENVTTVGLDEESVFIGDVLVIGSARFEVSQPRQPCFKLGLRFEDNSLGRIMMRENRTGWYTRVIQAGEMTAGDGIEVIHRPDSTWSIARFNQFVLHKAATKEELRELASLEGLADHWRVAIAAALRG